LTIRWQLAGEVGSAHSSIPPHTAGIIEIKPGHTPKAGEVLALNFIDAQSLGVDSYRLPFGQALPDMPPLRHPGAAPLRILRETLLSGPGTRIVGQDFELVFDQATVSRSPK
jgi:hypothetical protein